MDEEVSLPADTLAILNEFLKEKAEREAKENQLITSKCELNSSDDGDKIFFEENWNLSQFWYSEKTRLELMQIIQKLILSDDFEIALLSCPSLYKSIKNVHSKTKIFEFDERFAAFGNDFVFYDFNKADDSNYLDEFKSFFDIIIVDPPFLSEDCIKQIAEIVKKISKNDTKIIFCSGDIVETWLKKYLNLTRTKFVPEHERNLGNEFASYTNFKLEFR